MTDEQIIKAYEGLTPRQQLNLYRNLYYNDGYATERGVIANAINDILPEYERQKEEIVDEREKKEMFAAVIARQDKERAVIVADRDNLLKENNRLENHFRDLTKMIRAEAIKEFAERLKKTYENHIVCTWTVLNPEIDNLVKEMTEE